MDLRAGLDREVRRLTVMLSITADNYVQVFMGLYTEETRTNQSKVIRSHSGNSLVPFHRVG